MADAVPNPPEKMKSRVVRARHVREIVAQAMADIGQEVMIDFREHWPKGAINPPGLSDATGAVQSGAQGANSQQAFEEIDTTGSYHPGFHEAD